jgi:major membrane immunogen (membrane-anchored lipoprotein)
VLNVLCDKDAPMRRQGLVFLLAASLLVFGCSSNDEKPEGATDTPAAEGEAASLDGGDTAAPSGDAALDQASTDGKG